MERPPGASHKCQARTREAPVSASTNGLLSLIDAMQQSMSVSLRSPDGVADPVALLWTDADAQWRPLIPTLQKVVPQLYILGPYAPDDPQGPLIWRKSIFY